jgi:Fe-S cluster assembly protein SufD
MGSTAPAAPRSAIDRLEGVALPTRRDEAWRYAPHRQLGELTFGTASSPTDGPVGVSDLGVDLDELLPAIDGPRIVVVNGVVDRQWSDLTGVDGVSISPLADALTDQPELVVARTERSDDDVIDAFAALNLAHGVDGVVITVADGVTLDTPIQIIDIAAPGAEVNTSCTGVVINLGTASAATVVESRFGVGERFGGSSVRSSIRVGDDARLDHIVIQDLPAGQVHLGAVEIVQGARSNVHARSFNLGAAYGRLECSVRLAGPGALVELSGLFFGVGDQILDQQISVVHAVEDCTSRQTYRGVLDGASTGVFNGGIDVRPGADGTDASQSNDNLLLSGRAEVNTQPRLEILADEVACKHGATVGQLDDTALYYLRSRGIGAEQARRLLINGFADQMIDDVGIDAVCSWITHRLGHDHD